MRQAIKIPIAPAERAADAAAFRMWLSPDVPDEGMTRTLLMCRKAIREELTGRQRNYAIAYYLEGKKLREIAADLNVAPSSVCRGLTRARQHLYRVLRYADPRLLGGQTKC